MDRKVRDHHENGAFDMNDRWTACQDIFYTRSRDSMARDDEDGDASLSSIDRAIDASIQLFGSAAGDRWDVRSIGQDDR